MSDLFTPHSFPVLPANPLLPSRESKSLLSVPSGPHELFFGRGASEGKFTTEKWAKLAKIARAQLLVTILRLATERKELRIVSDQIGGPTCASEVAAATTKILTSIRNRNDRGLAFSEVSGTYHMSAEGQTTWYESAKTILEKAEATSHIPEWLAAATKERPVIARRLIPISTEEFGYPTHRLSYSILSNARLIQRVALPDWHAQLQRCFVSESIAANLLAD